MTRSHSQLGLEQLEDRLVPTSVANISPSATTLLLSFDANSILASGPAGNPSNNGASQVVGPTASQNAILQAFAAWESTSNTGISIIAISGNAIGSTPANQGGASLAANGSATGLAQPVEVLQITVQNTGPKTDQTDAANASILANALAILVSQTPQATSNSNSILGSGAAPSASASKSSGANQNNDIQLCVGPLLTDTGTIPNNSLIPDFLWTGQSFKATIPISPMSPASYT
jgi:hypothetical protein